MVVVDRILILQPSDVSESADGVNASDICISDVVQGSHELVHKADIVIYSDGIRSKILKNRYSDSNVPQEIDILNVYVQMTAPVREIELEFKCVYDNE